jgi:hypothetical protein
MNATATATKNEQGSACVEQPKPKTRSGEARMADFSFDFRDHHGFERDINIGCNADSTVLVSITEMGVFGGQLLPFQGAASMEVHNIVPHNNGVVRVRGFIGWDTDVNVRLNILLV